MYHGRGPQYGDDVWLRKKGGGKRQYKRYAYIPLIIGSAMIIFGIVRCLITSGDPMVYIALGIGILIISPKVSPF